MGFGKDTLNLEKQFVFYASYHNTPVNVFIHLCCIWPILATGIFLMQYTPAVADTPAALANVLPYGQDVKLNLALLAALVYMVCYPLMDFFAGTVGSLLVGAIYLTSAHLAPQDIEVGGYPLWQVVLFVQVAAWILQFIGHGVFEGRAPALLDSLDQAFLTAPLFVLLEVFFFFGYRQSFYQSMMKKVEKNIAHFKREQKKKA